MSGETITATITLPTTAIALSAAPPSMVTQHTSLAVLGLKPRVFLQLVRDYRAAGHRVAAIGRVRMVELTRFSHFIFERESRQATDTDRLGEVANAIGLHLVGGAR